METTQVERRRMVTLPQEEFEAVLERAAERGALNALHEVGLDGEDAARDIRALRNLLDAWREARLATESEDRLAAIVDFTFNLGAGRLQMSTLRRRINQRDWSASAQELSRWIYGGGKVLPGLVARRRAEAALISDLRY